MKLLFKIVKRWTILIRYYSALFITGQYHSAKTMNTFQTLKTIKKKILQGGEWKLHRVPIGMTRCELIFYRLLSGFPDNGGLLDGWVVYIYIWLDMDNVFLKLDRNIDSEIGRW